MRILPPLQPRHDLLDPEPSLGDRFHRAVTYGATVSEVAPRVGTPSPRRPIVTLLRHLFFVLTSHFHNRAVTQGNWPVSDPPGGWNDPCDADQRASNEVKAMISATVFFTILFPLMLAIVLDIAGRELTVAPLVLRDQSMH